MELRDEILASFVRQNMDDGAIVNAVCYHTLKKIKAVLEDDSLDDVSCFQRIEQIVCLFEEIGSDGGNRHDFG